MPLWLQVVSTIVAASFTIGTAARGMATWVWANTIKRDMSDLSKRLDAIERAQKEATDRAHQHNKNFQRQISNQDEFLAGVGERIGMRRRFAQERDEEAS